MRAQNLTIFDEFVAMAATPSSVYTSTDFNAKLGQHNHIGIQAVVDNVTGGGSLNIWCEQSADGRVWLQRNTLASPVAEITWGAGTLSASAVNSKHWSDSCDGVSKETVAILGPLLAFVRFRIDLGANTSAHIRLYATLRDR